MNDDQEHHHHGWYGNPYARIFWPLLIGIILIIIGVSALLGINIWQYFWPVIAIVIGLLIIFSAIFGRRRRYKT